MVALSILLMEMYAEITLSELSDSQFIPLSDGETGGFRELSHLIN